MDKDKASEYDLSESEVIGRGAYGTVYLCKRKSDGRRLIFKEIPMGQMSAEDRQGAMNEVHVHKMLPPHANIVQHFDYFIYEQALIIVMEYVQGGTLYDFLIKRGSSLLEESEILHLFVQLALALHHIHSKSILHRDIKTQNILLDKSQSTVKLSDFGISKILASKSKAYSVVGTPCYISPELCESKPYNQKSDIWALGCVLYELCTLNRAFEAPNLPALVFKIMKGSYQHISDRYSPELRQLIRSLLNLDHTRRPNVSQILAQPIIIKVMYSCIVSIGAIKIKPQTDESEDQTYSARQSRSWSVKPADRMCSQPETGLARKCSIFTWGGKFPTPSKLPVPSGVDCVLDVAIGRSQKYALTKTGKIFTWEQVESSDAESSVVLPGMTSDFSVSTLLAPRSLEGQGGVTVAKIACGDLFAACVTDRGILMTMGSGSSGCLGHGNFQDVRQLKIVETLIGCEVMGVSCGSNHVVALTTDQELFAWGVGDSGRLGLGSAVHKGCNYPVAINAQVFESNVVSIHCAMDTTCFITRNNKIYVCGSNKQNKLCLDYKQEGKSVSVDSVSRPTRIKQELFSQIITCSVGNAHGAFITAQNDLILCGSNAFGQLATNNKYLPERHFRKLESEHKFRSVSCGDAFVIAVTTQGKVLSWGRNSKGRLGRTGGDGGEVPAVVDLDGNEASGGTGRGLEVVKLRSSHESTMLLADVLVQVASDDER